jgi:hypothetical protein
MSEIPAIDPAKLDIAADRLIDRELETWGQLAAEPWTVLDSPRYDHLIVLDADSAAIFEVSRHTPKIADRIIACVNSCKGINPEAVQDLLEACRATVAALLPLRQTDIHIGSLLNAALDQSLAAIAKATPTPAPDATIADASIVSMMQAAQVRRTTAATILADATQQATT